MLAQAWGWSWWIQAASVLALAAACSTAPAPPPVQIPAMPAPVLPTLAAVRYSAATSLPEYQREIAALLHAASAERVYGGAPPNPLRAVIVYYAEIDDASELAAYAAESLRRASPFPRPHPRLMNGAGRIVITESWLFDGAGRFRLRTLSLPQARSPQWHEEFP